MSGSAEILQSWFDEVPKGWNLTRVRDATRLINGYPFDSSRFSKTAGVRVVRIRDLLSDDDLTFYDGPPEERVRVLSGDLLIGMDGDFNVTPWQGGSALLNQRLCCLRESADFDRRFLHYMLPFPLKVINDLTYYTTVKHISSYQIRGIRFPCPRIDMQRKIADFLDRKTTAVDSIIREKNRLIDLLQEKRQALITQAVTKGLDLTVSTRDSGIEWLGKVPTHWKVKRLKDLTPQVTVGIVVTPARYYTDEGVPVLRSLNVHPGTIVEDDLRYISSESNDLHRKSMLFAGDLVAVRTGQPGTSAVVDSRFHKANCVDLIIVRQSKKLDMGFLCYFMNSEFARGQYEKGSEGAIQQHFNIETAKNLVLATPDVQEQEQISVFLDESTTRLDLLGSAVRNHIDKLYEYRQALVLGAVTGRIDVRAEAAA